MRQDQPRLMVFVYGTLKQGYDNHRRLMQGYESVEQATITGRLRDLSPTIPILEIPKCSILAHAGATAAEDLATQERVISSAPTTTSVHPGEDGWGEVEGEVFVFTGDIAERVRTLDLLEGCRPGANGNLYDRVMIAVHGARFPAAWTYILPLDKEPGEFNPARNPSRWPS